MVIDFINLLAVTSLILIRRHRGMKRPGPTLHVRLRETGPTDVLCTQVPDGWEFLQLELNRVWLRPVLEKVKTTLT